MDPKILLGRILQKMIDNGFCQVEGYNSFKYLSHTDKNIVIGRERGKDTKIRYEVIIKAIENYQKKPDDYDMGPNKTREYGITHVNSPVWSLLHLIDKTDYIR